MDFFLSLYLRAEVPWPALTPAFPGEYEVYIKEGKISVRAAVQ